LIKANQFLQICIESNVQTTQTWIPKRFGSL
jgi:hypothetical protein